jgi:hypothetical protein
MILQKALESAGGSRGLPLTVLRDSVDELALWLDRRSPARADSEPEQAGTLVVRASTDGITCPAQVRVYPTFEYSGGIPIPARDGRIKFWRAQTDESGVAMLTLPAGRPLLVEATHGFHISTDARIIELTNGKRTEIHANLTTLVNLRTRGILCGDMHHHSIYSSPAYGGTDHVVDTVQDVYGSMRAAGLDFGALSDHHNTLNHDVWQSFASDKFTPVLSKEISTSNGHVNQHGSLEDIVYRIPNAADRTDAYLLAEHRRVAGRIRESGGFPVINHPRSWQAAISFPEAFTNALPIFEGMEIWNGATPCLPGYPNDLATQLWLNRLDHGEYIPAVCGSDTHNIQSDDYQTISETLHSIRDRGESVYGEMPEAARRGYDWIVNAREAALLLYESWAEQCLGTGCVRNMVSSTSANAASILAALRQGRNTLTNGPLMFFRANGAEPGNTTQRGTPISVQVELYAKKPLHTLTLLGRGVSREIPLEPRASRQGLTDYSVSLDDADLGDTDYIAAIAEGGAVNRAVSNPVFIK